MPNESGNARKPGLSTIEGGKVKRGDEDRRKMMEIKMGRDRAGREKVIRWG